MTEARVLQFERPAKVFKALGHPTRLFIVHQLAKGEKCVCELTGLIGSDMSTVSRHLAQLREAGIVTSRKEGATIFYRLRTPCVLQVLGCVGEVLESSAEENQPPELPQQDQSE